MRRILITALILFMGLSGVAFGQSAKKAYDSLKRLEAKTQVGVTYSDYLKTLGEAKYTVESYTESSNTELAAFLKLALVNYETSAQVWDVDKSLVQKGWDNASKILNEVKRRMK